jgi:hypothetical protein
MPRETSLSSLTFFGRAFAAHGITTPVAQIHSLRAVRFLFFRRGAAIEMNGIHLKRDHQITSAPFKCPQRNASWKKSSRLRKTFRR